MPEALSRKPYPSPAPGVVANNVNWSWSWYVPVMGTRKVPLEKSGLGTSSTQVTPRLPSELPAELVMCRACVLDATNGCGRLAGFPGRPGRPSTPARPGCPGCPCWRAQHPSNLAISFFCVVEAAKASLKISRLLNPSESWERGLLIDLWRDGRPAKNKKKKES